MTLFLLYSQHSEDDALGAGLGLIATGLLIFLFFRWLKKRENTNKLLITKEAIAVVKKRTWASSGRGHHYIYEIEYVNDKKQTIQTRLDHSTLFHNYNIGHNITVYYDPENPENHYTNEKAKQNNSYYGYQIAVAVIFSLAGILSISSIDDYNELYIVQKVKSWFVKEEITDETRMLIRWGEYEENAVKSGLFLSYEDCDSLRIKSKKKPNTFQNKYSFFSAGDQETIYEDINADGKIDWCLSMTFYPCESSKPEANKRVTFLILSIDSLYYVDDKFADGWSDSLGDYKIDSVKNKNFYVRYGTNYSEKKIIQYPKTPN